MIAFCPYMAVSVEKNKLFDSKQFHTAVLVAILFIEQFIQIMQQKEDFSKNCNVTLKLQTKNDY